MREDTIGLFKFFLTSINRKTIFDTCKNITLVQDLFIFIFFSKFSFYKEYLFRGQQTIIIFINNHEYSKISAKII